VHCAPQSCHFAGAHVSAPVSQVVALGREVLGSNGLLTDFGTAKQFCDMEAIYSYEVGESVDRHMYCVSVLI
jgi:hypothetical protein